MDSKTVLAVLAMVFSVFSVLLSGWFSIRAARIRAELEAESERTQKPVSLVFGLRRVC